MFPIVKKRVLNETVTLMEIEAPLVARKALPGQFIIFRIDEEGERIPLTIAGYDREKGTVTIIFQIWKRSPDSWNWSLYLMRLKHLRKHCMWSSLLRKM